MDDVFTRAYIHTDILGQQIVKEKAAPWKKGLKSHLLVIIALVFCSLLFVWSRLQVVQIGYEISQGNKIYQGLVKENQHLRVEVSSLQSPSRIAEIAKTKLGLTNPKQEQIIIIP